ncbi:MAG TPA: DMT family transporter [Planctomycetota bacterium]|nr:DMT family transporter [Planctomycetota bacterium]
MNAGFVALMALAGFLMAFQAPINAALRTNVGVFESALVSFAVGTVLLVAIVLAAGKGSLAGLRSAPPWQYLGGGIGVLFVVASLLSAPKIGVAGLLVAALAGQLVGALAIDAFGWFSLERRPIDAWRVLGILLLIAAVWLLNGKGGPKP